MTSESNPFLKQKYTDLHRASDVERVVRRAERIAREKMPQDPMTRIQAYLDRFKEITERTDPEERERGIDAIKRLIHRIAVIKPEHIPESVFLLEQRIAREQGHGTIEITEEYREQKRKEIISNQAQGLDKWIDYLASQDAQYSDWAKYWVFRSMLSMGKFEKSEDVEGAEKAEFRTRKKDTVAMFPPMNPRALAVTIDAIVNRVNEKARSKTERRAIPNLSKKLDDAAFQRLVHTEDFSKIYTQFLIELPAYSREGLEDIRGAWVKYPQGSDPKPLVDSLEGYPLEWCTAGMDTARTQLQGGDFHVYYSIDEDGKPKIPRVAIRMEQDEIAEVRGIAPNQNLDPYISPVIEKKMAEFPDGEAYKKKAGDMKQLTTIEKKIQSGKTLNIVELRFLYEIDDKIEGFGYQRDARIVELRLQRNPEADMPVVFDCEQKQIARSLQEVNELTRAYVGPLTTGIFQRIRHVDNIYTSFPDKRIMRYSIDIGGQTEKQLEEDLERANICSSDDALHMMRSEQFKTATDPNQVDLVRLSAIDLFGDLSIDNLRKRTLDDMCKKAYELGLELCPAEVGPRLRLRLGDQPMWNWLHIAMKKISSSNGTPSVFSLRNYHHVIMLDHSGAMSRVDLWSPRVMVFRLPSRK